MNELLARGLTVEDVRRVLGANNRNVGASFIERGGEEYIVRGYGWIRSGEEGLSRHPQHRHRFSREGTPVYVGDVAEVTFGPAIRRGALKASRDLPSANQAAAADTSATPVRTVASQSQSQSQSPAHTPTEGAVGGFVQKLVGTNTQAVLGRVEEEITAINQALPEGMTLTPFYSQGTLVEKAVGTVTSSLAFGAVLVLLVLYLFMGDVRSTFIILSTVPLAFLVAFIGMWATGLSANLMTLGALAISIGMIGDGTTVVVENVYRLLEEREDTENISMVRLVGEAAREVGRPVVFASSIIIIVFLPLFTLQGVEGKLFTPMAYTITFALLGAVVLAITFAPVASSFLVSPKQTAGGEPWLLRWTKARFRPLAKWAVARPKTILSVVGVLFAGSLALFPFLGTEFVPTLREGTYAVRAVLPPGANLESTETYTERMQEVFQTFPEVESVHSRVGRAEVGGDPEPVNVVFNVVSLKPLDAWSSGRDYEGLQTAMAEQLQETVPGVAANFSQPIQLRTDELLSGVRAQVVASLYGDNLDVLAPRRRRWPR